MGRNVTCTMAGLLALAGVTMAVSESDAMPIQQLGAMAAPAAGIETVYYYGHYRRHGGYAYARPYYGYRHRYYGGYPYGYGYGYRRPVVGFGFGGGPYIGF